MLRSLRNSFLIFIICFTISARCAKLEEAKDYVAFTFTRDNHLVYYVENLGKCGYPEITSPTATACPAESPQEQVFNNEKSLGKNSVFVRDTYDPPQSSIDIAYHICETPYKMSVLYHRIAQEFRFGLEIYYDKVKFANEQFTDSKRWQYDLITNIYSKTNYAIPILSRVASVPAALGNLIPKPVTSVMSKILPYPKIYLDNKTELGFIMIFAFYSKFNFGLKRLAQVVYNLKPPTSEVYECKDWNLGKEYFTEIGIPIDTLYSGDNQKKILKGVKIPTSKPDNENEDNEDASCESENQCFTKWLAVPIQQFQIVETAPVSCSYLLSVPIWKSTIEDVLKKLDNFLSTVLKVMVKPIGAIWIHSGVHGELQLPTDSDTKQPLKTIKLAENDITAPDVIYKLIRYNQIICKVENGENDELKEESEKNNPKDEVEKGNEEDKPKNDTENEENKPLIENNKLDDNDKSEKLTEDAETDSSENDETDELFEDSSEEEEPPNSNCVSRETATIVVVHNNPNFNPETDRICNDMCESWGWDEIQFREVAGRRFKSKYIYCCGTTDPTVRKKLGLNIDKFIENTAPFALTFNWVPNFDKMHFNDIKNIRDDVVKEYRKIFEGESEPNENKNELAIVKFNQTGEEFFKIPKPKHDKDDPEKSETQLVDDEKMMKNFPNENQTK